MLTTKYDAQCRQGLTPSTNNENGSSSPSGLHNLESSSQERPPCTGAKLSLFDPGLRFLQDFDADVDRQTRALKIISKLSYMKSFKRYLNEYAANRGSKTAVGMRASNQHDIDVGQVWRPVEAVVKDDLLRIDKSTRSKYRTSHRNAPLWPPLIMNPAWLRPYCGLI